MIKLSGKPIFDGIEIGRAYYMRKARRPVSGRPCLSVKEEKERFHLALEYAVSETQKLELLARESLGQVYAQIFETYSLLLRDTTFVGDIEELISGGNICAEDALEEVGDRYYQKIQDIEDAYIRARGQDLLDVVERIRQGFEVDRVRSEASPSGKAILIADTLTPSEIIRISRDDVAGIVLREGTFDSHSAILIRSIGIPTLICKEAGEELHDKQVIIDSISGSLIVNPDQTTVSIYLERKEIELRRWELLHELKGKPNATRSGRKIEIYANIGDVRDLPGVLSNDAGGIGLFRSEFLYLGRESIPSEEEQFEAYRLAAGVMDGKPVVIRTLDVGADKRVDYFGLDDEANPAMGKRAIRLCLERQDIFLSQLRAILRASVFGEIAILYPMITSVSELDKIESLMTEARHSLAREGVRFGSPRQGIMIETPAAAMISDVLAKRVDFFSIGTNDLSQYMLALDRQNISLESYFDPYHEAVLRMIRLVTDNAHAAGITVTVCGELGADKNLTEFFINTGVDGLSVSPAFVLPLRKRIMEME